MYVYVLDGPASSSSVLAGAQQLAAALSRDGLKFNRSHFAVAMYQGPVKPAQHFDEVWFMPATGPVIDFAAVEVGSF